MVGAWVGSPFFLLKVRFQSQTSAKELVVGHQHNYSSFVQAITHIHKEGGITNFFRGSTAQMLRVGVGSMAQLLTFDYAKHFLKDKLAGTTLDLTSALIAGLALAVAMNPVDVVATRLYNQEVKGKTGSLYKGPVDCLIKILTHEGPQGFFKGLGAHYLRVGPHTIATFVCWGWTKKIMAKLDRFIPQDNNL